MTSEYIHREPWFTVRRETVELPGGIRIPSYHLLEYPDWVNVIAITRKKKFIFVRQYRHGLARVDYELCAGVCEKEDVLPLVSAQRELLEETGYGNGVWEKYMTLSPNPSTHTNVTHCFLATGVEKVGRQQLEATENLSVHLLSFDRVKALLSSNRIRQSLMAAPLWRFVAENG